MGLSGIVASTQLVVQPSESGIPELRNLLRCLAADARMGELNLFVSKNIPAMISFATLIATDASSERFVKEMFIDIDSEIMQYQDRFSKDEWADGVQKFKTSTCPQAQAFPPILSSIRIDYRRSDVLQMGWKNSQVTIHTLRTVINKGGYHKRRWDVRVDRKTNATDFHWSQDLLNQLLLRPYAKCKYRLEAGMEAEYTAERKAVTNFEYGDRGNYTY